jgi:hypothetical protein
MAEVHEVYRPRRRARLWPSVVMLILVLLLIGVIVAMIMNVRGSVTWPAGGVEFGFRPHMYINRTLPADVAGPTRVAIDVGAATSAADTQTPVEPVAPASDVAPPPASGPSDAVEQSQPAEAGAPAATTPADPLAPIE